MAAAYNLRKAEAKREYSRKYRAANRERINEQNRAWRAANPEKVKAAKEIPDHLCAMQK